MDETNQGVLMCVCVPCCTITLVTIQTPGLLRHVCAAWCVELASFPANWNLENSSLVVNDVLGVV